MKSERVKNYIAICNSFQPILKGMSKLQSIRARSIYERMKFENFICFEWEYGQNPCLKMPKILQIASYPHSYRYYDSVPKIISKYIANKTFKNFIESSIRGKFHKNSQNFMELARKSREESTFSHKFQKIMPQCLSKIFSKSPDPASSFSDLK